MALAACNTQQSATAPKAESWAVYYDREQAPDAFVPFDTIVLDGEAHPDLNALKAQGKTLMGYVSLAEVRGDSDLYQFAKNEGLVLQKNPNWDSYAVDIRKPEWQRKLLKDVLPAVMKRGFDGVMLDTVDSAIALEQQDPAKYAGMQAAAIKLVGKIRAAYPDSKLMLNRGFDILDSVRDDVDMVLAESILAQYDFDTQKSSLFPSETYFELASFLKRMRSRSPHLKIYTIDYWNMDDAEGVAKLYNAQRAQGFVPYVATPDLMKLHYESAGDVPPAHVKGNRYA